MKQICDTCYKEFEDNGNPSVCIFESADSRVHRQIEIKEEFSKKMVPVYLCDECKKSLSNVVEKMDL